MSYDAFVSYASSDHDVAYALVDYLELCGINCWVAPRDVPGGRNYAEAILSALTESELFLLVFSEGSNDSEHVQREVERALHLSKPIVPVRIEDVMPSGAMDYYLATLHWIDAFEIKDAESASRGCEDVARAASSLLGREDSIRDSIAEHKRQIKEEDARREAEEREMRLRIEAEAHAKAEAEMAEERRRREEEAAAKEREQEEQRRKGEELEQQREEESLAALRQAETESQAQAGAGESSLAGQAVTDAGPAAQASSPGRDSSTRTLLVSAVLLVMVLVGTGWWAKNHFMPLADSGAGGGQDGEGLPPDSSDTPSPAPKPEPPPEPEPEPQPEPDPDPKPAPVPEPTPLVTQDPGPDKDPTPPVPKPPAVASLRAKFLWAGEERFVPAPLAQRFRVAPGDAGKISGSEEKGDRLRVTLPDAKEGDTPLQVEVELNIPGFVPASRKVALEAGDSDVDFGELARPDGNVRIRSDYADLPRASEAHEAWIEKLVLAWEAPLASGDSGADEKLAGWVKDLHMAGAPAEREWSPFIDDAVNETLPGGVYGAYLVTGCLAPFDRVRIATVEIGPGKTGTEVAVPIVPIGVFGGETSWTSTTTEAGKDADGTVTWTFYNLPAALDFSESGPRMVQSYTDIVSDGEMLKKFYLPAPVTGGTFEPSEGLWKLAANPAKIVRSLVDDDLTDRYFEKIEFSLRYHGDNRGILFDAETVDQPLNATAGTKRSFTLQNAYPVFAEAIPALAAKYPGFGVLDVTKVYSHLAAANEQNAEAFRRSLTVPASMGTPLGVSLGVEVDRSFAGSDSVRLESVEPAGPGGVAGLQAGDLVVSMGGIPIDGLEAFYRVRFGLAAGAAIEIKVVRAGKNLTLVVTPAAAP